MNEIDLCLEKTNEMLHTFYRHVPFEGARCA